MSAELQPEDDDVLQEETPAAPLPTIPVSVDGPVRTVELPAKSSGASTLRVAVGETVRIPGDPKRKRLTLIGVDNPFYIAPKAAQAKNASVAGKVPANLVLPLSACDDWYLSSAHATDPANITFIAEQWAQ